MNMPSKQTPWEIVREHYDFLDPFGALMDERHYQIETVNELAPLPRAGYYLGVGCVDSETEYLSPTGWKKISEYSGGLVGQYNLDGTVEFVEPSEYVKLPCQEMIRFKTKYGIDQLLSPEHRVLYRSEPYHQMRVKRAEEIEADHIRNAMGWKGGNIPTTFTPKIATTLPLTDAQLRVQVAVIADGHFSGNSNRCVIRVKKDRKKERLMALLFGAGIEYEVVPEEWGGCEGFFRFVFNAPTRDKEFGEDYWRANLDQLKVITDEVLHWDGTHRKGGAFFTSSKASADFIQYAFTSTGRRARVTSSVRVREDRKTSEEFTVLVSSGSPFIALHGHNGGTKTDVIWREPSTDGFKYCFMVPSTFLVFRRNGCIFASGNTGKTMVSTASALYKRMAEGADVVICVMPPILISGWYRWLTERVIPKKGLPPLKVVSYVGSPKQREKLQIRGADFILMSRVIFKSDFNHLTRTLGGLKIIYIRDEADDIKNVSTQNYKKTSEMVNVYGADFLPLTGTPLSTPLDGYALIKLVSPSIYRNLHHFENVHVAERDFFKNIAAWKNLDLLAENMKVNSVRLQRREIRGDLPPMTFNPIRYDLAPDHYALYQQLAEEQLLELEDGGKIDGTTEQALFYALQQIVVNYDHFSGNSANVSAVFELIDQIMCDLDGEKLIIVANYRMSNRKVLEHLKKYNAVAIYGEISPKEKDQAVQTFINDPECRVMTIHPKAAGYGVDGLQFVCSDMLFIELPGIAKDFHQTVGRLDRDGQKNPVNVMIAVANGTAQVKKLRDLVNNDELVGKVQPNIQDLRVSIFGG